jgi:hypothetical protein
MLPEPPCSSCCLSPLTSHRWV